MTNRSLSLRPLAAQHVALIFGAVFLMLLFACPMWVGIASVLRAGGPYGSYSARDPHIIGDFFSDPRNLMSIWRSLAFATVSATAQFFVSLMLARLLFHARGSWLLSICLIPIAIPPIATAMMWKALFDFQSGAINIMLSAVGLSPIPWLSTIPLFPSSPAGLSVTWAQLSIFLTDTWAWLPFLVGAQLLAFGRVPHHLIESAALEGATDGDVFWKVICPLSRSYLVILFFLRFLDSYRTFDTVWAFFGRLPAVEQFSARVYSVGYFERDYVSSLLLVAIGVVAISPVSTSLLAIARRVLVRDGKDLNAATN
jgi:multiple sugar transport system permease protein